MIRRHITATTLIFSLCMGACLCNAADSTSVADSAIVYPKAQRDRAPFEYILALPSIALQLPFKVLAGMVAAPVILVERQDLMPHVQELISAIDVDGFRPVLGYSSTKGFTGGIAYRKRSLFAPGVGFGVKGSYSTNLYRFASVTLGGKRWGDGPFGLVGEVGWQARTRERFHGLGPSSKLEDESNYGYRGMFASLQGYYQVSHGLESQVFGAFRRVDPRDGRLTTERNNRDSIAAYFAGQDLYGLFDRIDLIEFGGQLTHDWRERPGSPLSGGIEVLRVSYVTGDGGDNEDIGFWRVHGEAWHYLNLFRGRVIGLRVLAEMTEQNENTRIPFYELSRLGGAETLRGFRHGRFIDRDLLAFTVEYRWPLWRSLDAFLFTDQGRVFNSLEDDFEFSNFQSAYGGGLRFWSRSSTNEIAIAKSKEKLRFYFSLGAL